jgi:hypothetical protein
MSRWGKPRKNVKRIDPRYFMAEKMDRVLNENVGDPVGAALHNQLTRNKATTPTMAMDVGELFDSERGLVWQELARMGIDEDDIHRMKGQKSEYYERDSGRGTNPRGEAYVWLKVGISGEDKIYIDPEWREKAPLGQGSDWQRPGTHASPDPTGRLDRLGRIAPTKLKS